jgi:protein-S-isoprenylcysteine O-methyltransferase Ste14
MDPLRVALFAGLVFHKLVWEVLKKRSRLPQPSRESRPVGTRLIKPVKILVLGFLAIQALFLDLLPILYQPTALRIFGTVIFCIGLATAVLGRVQLGDNWLDLEDARVLPRQTVITTGIYRYVRHPIYTGDIILLIGLELALNSWLVIAMVVPILIVMRQIFQEESFLSQTFPAYRHYCERTKRFIPFIV